MSEHRDPLRDQPLPIVTDQPYVYQRVQEDLARRAEHGARKYGTALQPFNGRNALLDAYEEVLDLAVYLKQRLMEDEHGDEAATELATPEGR